MRLIGMLDSPYVRRVAIGLRLLGLKFEHEPLSVFRTFDQFHAINPVVKAPTLVCDDGTVLMDSNLILEYAQALAQRSLLPQGLPERTADLRLTGLALAACEKSVQIIYERNLRPAAKQHEPWVTRITGQMLAAFGGLEAMLAQRPPAAAAEAMTQGGLITAVTWHFTQQMLPQLVPPPRHPALSRFSAAAESTAAFQAAPHGSGTVR
ncbi:MAG TPA: glutathione S-transferase [Steroidobacteraceae bacterium]|nr:glutathione S-transferase [Steroidobacteraceae bacterium]